MIFSPQYHARILRLGAASLPRLSLSYPQTTTCNSETRQAERSNWGASSLWRH